MAVRCGITWIQWLLCLHAALRQIIDVYTDKTQRGFRNIQKNEARKIWEQAPWCRRTKNIGICWRCTMKSHDGNPQQVIGWPPISWTHVLSELITRCLTDGAYHWWNQRSVIAQQMQRQRNSCGRYYPSWCSIIWNWWKLVPSRQSINIQRINQWKNICQILEILLTENIYVSTAIKE